MPKSAGNGSLTYSRILSFWIPLAVMWVMMAAEQPALTAVIARLPNAEVNLAGFGVVLAISLVIESPVIQMLATATALADSRQNYQLLLKLMHVMGLALTVIHLLVGLTPVYGMLVEGLLNVPTQVAETARLPFIVMTPFSAAVGYRRLWQGMLIRHGKTWIVPVTMISRLAVIALVVVIGFGSARLGGAMLASISLSVGVTAAMIAAGLLNRLLVIRHLPEQSNKRHTRKSLLKFYLPLSLTTIVFLSAQPLLTFGMARGIDPTRSLAVFPVVNGFLFLFSSIGLSYQETAIALLNRSTDNRPVLRRFTGMLAVSVSGMMLVAGLTPVGAWWFGSVSGLSESLLPLVRVPVLILSIIPGLLAYKAWFRAQFVTSARTVILAQGVVLYTISLFVAVLVGSSTLPLVGVTVATIALVLAQLLENGYLLFRRTGESPSELDLAAGNAP